MTPSKPSAQVFYGEKDGPRRSANGNNGLRASFPASLPRTGKKEFQPHHPTPPMCTYNGPRARPPPPRQRANRKAPPKNHSLKKRGGLCRKGEGRETVLWRKMKRLQTVSQFRPRPRPETWRWPLHSLENSRGLGIRGGDPFHVKRKRTFIRGWGAIFTSLFQCRRDLKTRGHNRVLLLVGMRKVLQGQ